MTTTLFTGGWTFHRDHNLDANAVLELNSIAGLPVRLPHDAMIAQPRTDQGGSGNHGGFFTGGRYTYRTSWTAPEDAGTITYRLMFEGVYGVARVLVDGVEVAHNDSPYREFTASLAGVRPGSTASIVVEVDNRATPNSRWYTGSGIYRPVWLQALTRRRIAGDGLRVVTRSVPVPGATGPTRAVVDVKVALEGPRVAGERVLAQFERDGAVVAQAEGAVSVDAADLTLTLDEPQLWSHDNPHLYDLRVRLLVGGEAVDERVEHTGLRTIEVDARRGLRINGRSVLLRGTAVHHDNGPLGAATFAAAEWRRARALKEAGFNAVRSAHNPLSRSFLDACDALGLYVMDELTDVWVRHKTPHDEAERFLDSWREDVASMIAKDRNRPSVILYSIGNEIAESATPEGVAIAHHISRHVREQDPTRPTTIAVNPLLAMMASRSASAGTGEQGPAERSPATSTLANEVAARMGRLMVLASRLPAAERATRDVFEAVDVAGYNYGYASYPAARRRHPHRVIVGTESLLGDLPAIWKRVTSDPGVIGDFSWTGWDYLGEVGLGYWSYGSEPGGIAKPYPGVLAGCGAFDITGISGAALMLVQAVWGTTDVPGIAVRPLDRAGQRPNRSPWLPSDAVASWSWGQLSGTAQIEVYTTGDRVELLLNGQSLGRRTPRGFVARFRTPYRPGELTAIAYRGGVEIGRRSLRSAGAPRLRARAESADLRGPDDLSYVWLELADEAGTVASTHEDTISVSVCGPATLIALGSAAPSTTEGFTSFTRTTFRGRVLAIVRGTDESGEVTVRASSKNHGDASLTLTATGSTRHLVAAARKE
ncbi:glycoside hydrolase family 2 TIM barrel-domain containing protein [Kineococcus rhizosphaerae]|uniref:Glycosyl hydrolase family 2 n=1 Tax=Kineococcus rhizosphaerae TaxID=559628 RepID=A0A2T0R2C0_9ACTN|nr:glycoside hydrolase family 2 TIM barrel-domain containing protein [Kineococcus rhizosphaerae]PRY13949.1 glycosyl hydrolase family 2 [Kineococcus rhizosphaerae]